MLLKSIVCLGAAGWVFADSPRVLTDGTNSKSPIQVGTPTLEVDHGRRSRVRCQIINSSDKELRQLRIGAKILDPEGKDYRDSYTQEVASLGPKQSYEFVSYFSNDSQIPLPTLKAKIWVSHAP